MPRYLLIYYNYKYLLVKLILLKVQVCILVHLLYKWLKFQIYLGKKIFSFKFDLLSYCYNLQNYKLSVVDILANPTILLGHPFLSLFFVTLFCHTFLSHYSVTLFCHTILSHFSVIFVFHTFLSCFFILLSPP